jgi:glycosyltransferase involved in cell wall biosynthesis
MITNTFAPHVGGVAGSVTTLAEELRRQGHGVLIVAPMFDGTPEREDDVVRIRALTNFNGSKFSVVLPPRLMLAGVVDRIKPDIIHSHHPFLLGATAARLARSRKIPLVFTHHTLYERYTHYLPGDSQAMKHLAVRLSTRYANRCTRVFAPSRSVVEILRSRGVSSPISVVPSGIRLDDFRLGDGDRSRSAMGIPADAIVVGHVGRLAEEKNLSFLAYAMGAFVSRTPQACALIVGQGPSEAAMRAIFCEMGVGDRVFFAGELRSSQLVDAYHAMDVFAFASLTETQGLVLAEAMACGLPVVAVDAPGVREVLRDRVNGRMLDTADSMAFAEATGWVVSRSDEDAKRMQGAARDSARSFSLEPIVERVVALYGRALADRRDRRIVVPARFGAPAPIPKNPTGLKLLRPVFGYGGSRVMEAIGKVSRPDGVVLKRIGHGLRSLHGAPTIVCGLALFFANPQSIKAMVLAATAAELSEDPGDIIANLLRREIGTLAAGMLVLAASCLLLNGLVRVLIAVAPHVGKRWAYFVGAGLAAAGVACIGCWLAIAWSWALFFVAFLNAMTFSRVLRHWAAFPRTLKVSPEPGEGE